MHMCDETMFHTELADIPNAQCGDAAMDLGLHNDLLDSNDDLPRMESMDIGLASNVNEISAAQVVSVTAADHEFEQMLKVQLSKVLKCEACLQTSKDSCLCSQPRSSSLITRKISTTH